MTSPILLVTGGSRGIGAATAKLAAARGFDVAINYNRDQDAAKAVAAAVRDAGRKALVVKADVRQEVEVSVMFDLIDARLGRVTHLLCSSGITGPVSTIETIEEAALQDIFNINVLGTLYCVRAAIPRISTKHGGSGGAIVLMSSMAATLGGANEFIAYAASKGAIDSMTIGLARELAGEGIRVNAVAPGLIDTEIQPKGRVERIGPSVPVGRAGTADEVAEAIMFLLSEPSSAYIAGTVLRISGGR